MNRKSIFLIILAVLIFASIQALLPKFSQQNSVVTNKPLSNPEVTTDSPEITVDYPKPNDVVISPLVVNGRAKGSWYFEGQFPVKLVYGNNRETVEAIAYAKGEWMTEDYVDFEATINFSQPTASTGLLILKKDNPSGLLENDASLSIPIRF